MHIRRSLPSILTARFVLAATGMARDAEARLAVRTPVEPTPAPTTSPPEAGDATGVNVEVNYPGAKLDLVPPVLNETGVGGTFLFGDNDTAPFDGLNDQLTAGLIAIPGPIPGGSFASAVFNCRDGQAGPNQAEFSCTADASDINGLPVSATCSVSLNVVP